MNGRIKHRGFTLRELLVVLGIIGLILALLAPMVNNARTPSRGNICRNNMRNLALATMQYDMAHNHYPGFHESAIDASGERFSRPLLYLLLPYLERPDLFEAFSADKHPYHGVSTMPSNHVGALMLCPSAEYAEPPKLLNRPSSYIYNTGMPDVPSASAPPDWPANGVIQNRYLADCLGIALLDNSSSYITRGDGTTNTLLLSERREFHRWTDTAEYDVGFVWHPRFEKEPWAQLNSKPPGAHAASKYVLARPSSHHPGVANVAFCDGHARTIAEGIDYRVYAQLMTPRGSDATYPGLRDGKEVPVEDAFRNHVVYDDDY